MYNKINITENGLQIISLFTNGFDREYYIREVEKLLKISPRTAQLILEDLENKGIIESKVRGKIKSYKLKINELSNRYLTFVEQYKSIAFMEKNLLVKEIIEKISPFINGIGIIFGSYAKGTEKDDSDIDMFIIGDKKGRDYVSSGEKFDLDISVKYFQPDIFRDLLGKKNPLAMEIMENHILLSGFEQFMRLRKDEK